MEGNWRGRGRTFEGKGRGRIVEGKGRDGRRAGASLVTSLLKLHGMGYLALSAPSAPHYHSRTRNLRR